MSNYQYQNNSSGGDKVLNWIVILAGLLLYTKTAYVFSFFAPEILNEIIGFDVSIGYGLLTAGLVEFLAGILHFERRAKRSTSAQIVKWNALLISGLCQIFSGYISMDNTQSLTDTMRLLLFWGVPLIPLLIVIMVFTIGRLPDDDEYRPSIRERGLKSYVPNFRQLWEGTGVYPAQTTQVVRQIENQDLPEPDQMATRGGGDAGDANFTQQGGRSQ